MDNNDKLTAIHAVGGIKTVLAAVVPFGGAINEAINLVKDHYLEIRLQSIEHILNTHIESHGLSIEEFISKTSDLDEHDYYVVRKSFKYLILEAQPETVEVLTKAMVDYSLKIDQDINQIVCEVLGELNSFDIKLLHSIKEYINSSVHKEDNKKLLKLNTQETIKRDNGRNKNSSRYKRTNLIERNVVRGIYTVMWRNFGINFQDEKDGKAKVLPATEAINSELLNKEKVVYTLALEVTSIIKMEKLGILETEHVTTLGSSSFLNISRFHITLLGRKILDYIDIEKEEK